MSEKYERFRKHRLHIMVTEKEKEIIKEHARQCNIKSVSEFLRIMGIDGTIFVVDESERIEKAAHGLHDIGVVLNKIAKHANQTGHISDRELEIVANYQLQIAEILKDVLYSGGSEDSF